MQGVETLPQRMDAHLANARVVADALCTNPAVSWVRWAGLADHPHHQRAPRYLPLGPGAVFSFGVAGGRDAGRAFIEALELCSHLANIGDTRTLVIHPASTTHRQLSDDGARGRRRAARPDPHLGRDRGCRRHHLGHRAGADRGDARPTQMTPEWHNPTASERLEIIRSTRRWPSSECRPTRVGRATSSPRICCRRAATFEHVWFVNPKGGEVLGRPVYPSLAELPGVPDLVDVFRRADDLPGGCRRSSWRCRAHGRSGLSWA